MLNELAWKNQEEVGILISPVAKLCRVSHPNNTSPLKHAKREKMSILAEIYHGGTPMLFFLFILFLVFKLAGAITWSWWFVTLPLWILLAHVVAEKCFGTNLAQHACKPFGCCKKDCE